jgi:hypothetical protein
MTAEIIKLPYNVTRGAHSRKPRRSKNGTPEERAAKAGQPATVTTLRTEAQSAAPASDDPIFFEIERHRAALAAYNLAVDREDENSGQLCSDMFLMSRCLVLTRPETRRGLIALAKYLEEQFDMEADCAGCMSMEDKIGGKLWPQVFMRTLQHALRHMGGEL